MTIYRAHVCTSFNPRVREGRDFRLIHPPVFQPGFNPRVREGRDGQGMG